MHWPNSEKWPPLELVDRTELDTTNCNSSPLSIASATSRIPIVMGLRRTIFCFASVVPTAQFPIGWRTQHHERTPHHTTPSPWWQGQFCDLSPSRSTKVCVAAEEIKANHSTDFAAMGHSDYRLERTPSRLCGSTWTAQHSLPRVLYLSCSSTCNSNAHISPRL